MSDLESKFKEIREKHNAILPVVEDGEVSFTLHDPDVQRHNYWYFKCSTHWEHWFREETPESRAFLEDLIKEGIVTIDGKANFSHPG